MRSGAPQAGQRTIDRVALWITGAILLAFLIGFERFLAGSWRHLGALMAAMAAYLGGVIALDRVVRRMGMPSETVAAPVWSLPIIPLIGAVAGATYSLVETGRLAAMPVLSGALIGTMLLLSSLPRWRRLRNGADPSVPEQD
jgi:hypothetical protein